MDLSVDPVRRARVQRLAVKMSNRTVAALKEFEPLGARHIGMRPDHLCRGAVGTLLTPGSSVAACARRFEGHLNVNAQI
jgi:hypothetical protein